MKRKQPVRLQKRIRPGFRPPSHSSNFPWKWAIIGGLIIAVVILLVLVIRNGGANAAIPQVTITVTAAHTQVPTDTPQPVATSTVTTRECVVKEDTWLYREPDDGSVSQTWPAGRTVNVIDAIETNGRQWFRVILTGRNDIIWYVHTDTVECK